MPPSQQVNLQIVYLFIDCCHFTGIDDKFMKPCGRILQAAAFAAGISIVHSRQAVNSFPYDANLSDCSCS